MRRLLIVLALVVGSGIGAASATATPPATATATGSFAILTDTFTPVRLQKAGCVGYFDESATLVYSGVLTGPATDTDLAISYCDGSFAGVSGTEVCSGCTLDGRTGDFTAAFHYAGSGANYSGSLVVLSATGGLTGLHLQGSFQGDSGGNTYSYSYHFDH